MSDPGAPRNALTVDVEDYFHAEALATVAPRERWSSLPQRVVANTDRLLERFAERGVRGTFFVLGWVAERHPELVRRIADAGHEIACHGLTHRLVYRQTPDEFRRETLRARALLQDASGQSVDGYRAASFSITRESLWALQILVEAGFRYDSSIFPVRHDVYGMPGAPTTPCCLRTPSGSLVEVPLTTVRVAGMTLPCAGGGYYRLLPALLGLGMLRRVRREGRPFVFYLHPWEIDPAQPRFSLPLRSRLRHYTNLGGFERKLERLLDEFSFGTMATLVEHAFREAGTTLELEALAA